MRINVRALLGFVALAVCAPLALAQGTPGQSQGSTQTPPAQSQMQGPRQMGPPGQMGSGMGGMRGQFRPGMRGQMGIRHWRHRYGMRGRMGYRGNFGGARPMWGGGMSMRRGPMGGMMGGRGPMGRAGMMGRGPGFGGGRGMGPGGRGPMALNRVLNNPDLQKQIGVTLEQVAKIKQQNTDFEKFNIQNRATQETNRLELRQLMSATTPDRAAIDVKLGQISSAQLAAEKERVHHQLDMQNALTADQKTKLQQLMQQNRPGMGPRGRGGRGGPGMGPGRGNGQQNPNGSGAGGGIGDASGSSDGTTI
jgi:Spy/CpxP family protein refolding chaperone